MNIRDMEYLTAVADLGNFSRAAEQCNVSQPTLSAQIKKMEEFLDIQMIERGGRQARLTAAGGQIAACARRILRENRRIMEIAAEAGDPMAGSFRLGAFPTLAPYFFPQAVGAIKRAAPRLRLMLTEDKTRTLLERLAAGDLDAALLALPVTDPQFTAKPLFTEPFYVAVPRDHPLSLRDEVCTGELRRHKVMLLEEGHCLRDQALDICALAGIREDQEYSATGLETLRQTVIAGTGITLIPRIAAAAADGIKYLPFKENPPSRTVALVWRKSVQRPEAIEAVYAACESVAPQAEPG